MKIAATLFAIAVVGAAAFVQSGVYDVSATNQHLAPTYWLMEATMRRAVAQRAAQITVPPLDRPETIAVGLVLYRAQCVKCHGAPGVAPDPFALGMTPLPAPLSQTAREWQPAEIFWVVKYGLKMTGMPAWEFRLSDDAIWAVVAFINQLQRLSPREYARLTAPPAAPPAAPAAGVPLNAHADPVRGKTALQQYACVACHEIPGITGATARVGPPLGGIATRGLLGGILPNTPENMLRWLREPQAVAPPTAMPDLGVTERDARDMAAYLATLK
jgi:mono/diheme cytochrome c family protein